MIPLSLPRRRQPVGDFIQDRRFTHEEVARALGCKVPRVNTIISGAVYPTAAEIEALERLIGLPIQVMFEDEVLKYFNPLGSIYSQVRRSAEGLDK
ncbi:helix-turn-helix domain-containing protein [Salinibacterium sp. dk5596]|uniref:helix-turn-helix domain-containing protein n=1 Tax=unclassified Salinibacterium TaxID=2632331 RepID=UPI00351A17F4